MPATLVDALSSSRWRSAGSTMREPKTACAFCIVSSVAVFEEVAGGQVDEVP